jgi:fructose-1,6-bisphosphatase
MAHFVIGDLHGYLSDFRRLLVESQLCDDQCQWVGGEHNLWMIGDFFDRGDAGVACVDLIMDLQRQAAAVGGSVQGLLGNHELMVLAAYKFGDRPTSAGQSFSQMWQRWGGVAEEMSRLTPEHVAWLERLPAMQRVDNRLLLHADNMFYVEHGRSVEAVNKNLFALTQDDDHERWFSVLRSFSERQAFSSLSMTGGQRAKQMLRYFGAEQLIHGHTPISEANGTPPESVVQAWVYADEQCVNVDGGLYLGGPGFVYRF